jgi:hypothetical protein
MNNKILRRVKILKEIEVRDINEMMIARAYTIPS